MKKFSLLIISLLTVAAANATEIGDDGFGQRPLKKTTTTTETTSSKKDSNSGFGRNRKVYGYEVSVGVRAGIGFSSMSESDGLEFSDGMGVGFGGGVVVALSVRQFITYHLGQFKVVLLHGSLHHVGQQHVVHAANRQGHGTLIVWHLVLSAKLLVFYPNAYVVLYSGHYGGGYVGFQRQ